MLRSPPSQMHNFILLVTVISLGITFTAAESLLKIKKCCSKHQQLFLDDLNNLICTDITRESKNGNKILLELEDDRENDHGTQQKKTGSKREETKDGNRDSMENEIEVCNESLNKSCAKDVNEFEKKRVGDISNIWWISDSLKFVRINNNTETNRVEVSLTRDNFIYNDPIPCFENQPELLLVESNNVFIDVDSSELVITQTENVPEYKVENAHKSRKKRKEPETKDHDTREQSKYRQIKTDINDDIYEVSRRNEIISKKARKERRETQSSLEGKGQIDESINLETPQNNQRIEERINGFEGGVEIVTADPNTHRKVPKTMLSNFPAQDYCIDRIEFRSEADEALEEENEQGADETGINTNDGNNTSNETTDESIDTSYVILLCPCLGKSNSSVVCVSKCCPDRQILHVSHGEDRSGHCGADGDFGSLNDPNKIFANQLELQGLLNTPHYIIHGTPRCSHGSYLLQGGTVPPYTILRNSSILLSHSGSQVPPSEYCIDSIHYTATEHRSDGNILLCRPPSVPEIRRLVYTICFIVGTTFLVLTLGVYAALTELRKSVHSWNIISHIACSIVAYVAIVIANLYPIEYPTLCVLLAYVIQTSFLSSQLWLNAMCIDIAFTFSGMRAPRGRNFSDLDRKKFLYYSAYTWGTTALIGGLTAVADQSSLLASDNPLKPNFGAKACWFKDSTALAVFFYGPIGLLLVINLVLFHYTCWKIRAAQKDTAITSAHRHVGGRTEDQTRLTTFIKLFLLMGVTWSFEIVSWAVGGPRYLWYLTDLLNVLRGLFIFVILCCKRHVLGLIKKRIQHGRRNLSLGPRSSRPRTRSESTNSRRHSKSSITTEQVALSRLNLHCNNQDQILEEEERTDERGEPPPTLGRVEEEVGDKVC